MWTASSGPEVEKVNLSRTSSLMPVTSFVDVPTAVMFEKVSRSAQEVSSMFRCWIVTTNVGELLTCVVSTVKTAASPPRGNAGLKKALPSSLKIVVPTIMDSHSSLGAWFLCVGPPRGRRDEDAEEAAGDARAAEGEREPDLLLEHREVERREPGRGDAREGARGDPGGVLEVLVLDDRVEREGPRADADVGRLDREEGRHPAAGERVGPVGRGPDLV